jgi:type II secretory pathway component HofQ
MAGANVKERIHHLMRYDTIKRRAWSHRAVLTILFLAISLSTVAATNVDAKQEPAQEERSEYTGAPISVDLKKADIRKVMATFSEMTGLDIVVAEGVEASVTMKADNMPWDEVLATILRDHGLQMAIDGKKVTITKQ